MPQAQSAKKASRPIGVTLLALWEFLVGIQLVLYGLAALSYSGTLVEGAPLKAVAFFIGVGGIVIGFLDLLLARGYIKGYERARRRGRSIAIGAIVLALLGSILLPAKLAPDSPFLTILLNVGVYLYLGSDKVVHYFRKSKA